MGKSVLIILFLLLSYFQTSAQIKINDFESNTHSEKFSFSLYGTYISSAELTNNLRNYIESNYSEPLLLDGGYGYGGEIEYNADVGDFILTFYFSTEYIKLKTNDLIYKFENREDEVYVKGTETLEMLPLEVGIKWMLPVGFNGLKLYIGTGAGIYIGDRTRTISYLTSKTISKKPGFSLNILTGIEYFIERNISSTFELKFRDGSFIVDSEFSNNTITINNNTYNLDTPILSRLNIDGVRLSLGLKYYFNL